MPSETQIVPYDSREGAGRLYVDAADEPNALLMLGHGAGGGVHAADLEWLARRLPATGTTVVRVEQPWRTAGGRVAVPPPRLDVGWRAAVDQVLARLPEAAGGPLLFGGRSAGARVGCRTAPDFAVAGVVCLAFPLHLPGRPEKSRAPELLTPAVPRLVLQGTRDTFGSAADLRAVAAADPGVVVVDLPGADHGFRLAKGAPGGTAQLRERVVGAVQQFIEVLCRGTGGGNTAEGSAL